MTPLDWNEIDVRAMLQRTFDKMSPRQRQAVAHGKANSTIGDIWMGFGKTLIGLTVGIIEKPDVWIILGSKSSMNVWKQEIRKWYPELAGEELYNIVRGQAAQRQNIWMKAKRKEGLFYATTFGSFIRDIDFILAQKISVQFISIDEPQKGGLRNRKTLGFKAVKAIQMATGCKIWMGSGSLTTKGVPQLWSYLHILNRKLFSSYWTWMQTFMLSVKGPFGVEYIRPKNNEQRARLMLPYIFKIGEKEAQVELPPLRRASLYAELTPKLASVYNTMSQELFMEFDGIDGESKFLAVANPLAAYTKLRQLITCPAIIDPALGPGVAIEAVIDKMLELEGQPGWTHNIVFTPYVGAIPIFKQQLSEGLGLKPEKIITLQGGMEPEQLQEAEVYFREDPNTLVLCSLSFAESFNLETGMNAYFPHFDWDQTKNEQAEARIRRRTSDRSRTIMSYYVNIIGSITTIMLDVLDGKVRNERLTYTDFVALRESLTKRIIGAD